MLIPSSTGDDACRKRTGASLHEHLMRDLAKSRIAREPAGLPLRWCEGTVHGIAHQVKPDGRLRGALEDSGVPEKNADGPLPRFRPAAVPDARTEVLRAASRPT
jgi:hypothetical protein